METAAFLANLIHANVDGYYGKTISHYRFKVNANALWRKAEAEGCEAEVSRLIWAAMPSRR